MSARTQTPPHLKWLINEMAAMQGELAAIAAEMTVLEGRRARLKVELASLETVTTAFTQDLGAVHVPVVRAHHRYGGRGNLRNYLRKLLQAAAPKSLDTMTMLDLVTEEFQLSLATPVQRSQFRRSAVTKALWHLAQRGEIERLHETEQGANGVGVWCWKSDAPLLSELREGR